MKSSAPLLSPILRSDTQGRMLAELIIDPARELSLTELAARCGVAVPTILRDVDRLIAGGYAKDRRIGRTRLVRIDSSHPMFEPLRKLIMYGYGPVAVIPGVLSQVERISRAFIYGSWAARYLGEPGEDPNDVDVLIVGDPNTGDVYHAARAASDVVGREVNVSAITEDRWERNEDGFVRTLRNRPIIELELEADP